jgi:lipoprotein-anchoring transpeptidase ErfK/SrfK
VAAPASSRTICDLLKRAALFLVFVAAGACTVGVAAPVASPPSVVIAAGVSVSGIELGGLTSEPARALLRRAAARPLTLEYRGRRWRVAPDELDATTAVDDAVARALAAPRSERVVLGVRVPQLAVRRYVARLARRIDRPAQNAVFTGLVNGRPFVTAERVGVSVRRAATAEAIVRELNRGSRRVLRPAVGRVQPAVTRRGFSPIVVIDRGANSLVLYRGMRRWRTFRVATGSPSYPTPSGNWRIVDKQRYPWWYPPASDWAKGLKPVPPGPGNPLGTRWMGLSASAVGIHGTPDAASIGYSASHGCIRMNVPEAEWLFEQVALGTPVVIV